MKKHIITHIKTVNPTSAENIAAGYNTGQEWINTTTGVKYYHKTNGVWEVATTNGTSGTGTTNKIPKWSGTSSQTDSSITDNGTLVTIAEDTKVSTGNFTLNATAFNENHAKLSNMQSSTGLYAFASGGITMASTTQFNVGSVQGFIVDSSNPLATPLFVNYPGGTNITTPYLATAPATYLLIKPDNTLLMLNTEPTVTQRRDNIYLGVVGHPGLTTLSGIGNSPDLCLNVFSQLRAFVHPIRFINEGIVPYAGAASLALYNTAGALYGLGIGFIANGNNSPTILQIAGGAPTTFQYRTQTGVAGANTTLIDPLLLDTAGTTSAYGGSVNQATIQRFYLLQNGNIRVQYGQTVYATLTAAVSAASTESFVVFSNNKTLGTLIGMLAVTKGCTSLQNTTTAQFLPVSKFGETVGAAAGISTSTSQSAYNNSSNPEIVTNSVLGAFTLRRGSAADTDNIYEGQNGAGTLTWMVDGNGKNTATSFVKSGATATDALMGTGVTTVLSSGTYSPTFTNVANTTLLAQNGTCSYMRIGNIVTVTVALSLSITSTATFTSFSVTLPINRATSTGTTMGNGSINYPGSGDYYTATATSTSTSTVNVAFYPPTGSGATSGNISFQYDVTS